MHAIRIVTLLLLLPLSASAAPAEDADDWKLIGGMLALVQQVVHLAANSPDPGAAQKGVDHILSGENAQANRIAAGVLDEVLQDVPAEQRGVFVAIGRDLLVLARRERAKAGAADQPAPTMDPVQARKDLQAMGLTYWDERQFLEAARRGDRIAVDLFLAARGLEARSPLPAR
jgi:hypothetical protein